MIFSKQKMDEAFAYTSRFYNKILLIDLEKDEFQPIKVNDKEWETLQNTGIHNFSDWIAGFFNSPFYSCKRDSAYVMKSIMTLRDIESLKKVTEPISIEYLKIIDGEYHEVELEYYPYEEDKGLLFIKDLYLMKKGIYENED